VQLGSRKLLDRAFTGLGMTSVLLLAAALLIIMGPILYGGVQAFVFRATVEHREAMGELFGRGDRAALEQELLDVYESRQEVYDCLTSFEEEMAADKRRFGRRQRLAYEEIRDRIRELFGPFPGEESPTLPRDRYGQTRWDHACTIRDKILWKETYEYPDPNAMGVLVLVPRVDDYQDTSLAALFPLLEKNLGEYMRPQRTFYWRFLFDTSHDDHFFGGIWAEVLGTFYLTVGAVLFAVPLGVISAIYLVEYAPQQSRAVEVLRTCISTLAGVPSIVFGLFGAAFFISTLHVSEGRSVLAGAMTLAVLILPFVIRSAEEALRAVPYTYKEAALSLGASRWRTITTVILPAALPGILTGIVISMGRAAGETAPIIFTAALSYGQPLGIWETFSNGTPALPWSIYSMCSEHEAAAELRHVQYGMVFTLVLLVLLLNSAAILIRARIVKRLRG
jgi:phosphate transport system permease protein